MKDHKVYLIHILEAVNAIENFVAGKGLEDFESDDLLQSAVIRKFEIIGEATKRIPENIKSMKPSIPWRSLAGMRDVMIHDYFFLETNEIWNTVHKDLPILKAQIKDLISSL
jgi:uncharacterized protein with HEPN domain